MKKIYIILIILFVLLFPFRFRLKDGGSIVYRSFIYEFTKVHSINDSCDSGFNDGYKFDLIGFNVYSNVTCDVTFKAKEK